MTNAGDNWKPVARELWGWPVAVLVSFPIGGLLADLVVDGVDSVGTALLGGLVAGAIIGAGEWLALRRWVAWLWIPATSAGLAAGLTAGQRSWTTGQAAETSWSSAPSAVTFESFHRYLGIGIGECLGYLLTGAWTTLVAVAMLQSSAFEPWLAWPGIVIGLFLVVGSLEFVGRFEEEGWALAGTIVPISYIAWSAWLVLSGVVLLVG